MKMPQGVAPLAGAWIETAFFSVNMPMIWVAPLAGAWIETFSSYNKVRIPGSHPSRVRGLKRYQNDSMGSVIDGRTPRGCVD